MTSVLHLLINAGFWNDSIYLGKFSVKNAVKNAHMGKAEPTRTLVPCWMSADLRPRYGLVRPSRAYDDMITTITAGP